MKTILLVVACQIMSTGALLAQTSDNQLAVNFHSESSAQARFSPVKKTLVKLYPNPSYGKLSISVNTNEVLNFYIFDLEGTLVYQTILKNKDRKIISNLKKGTYLYDVFEKDESIENGKIIIK